MIAESSPTGQQPHYKFAVNSTIVQHDFQIPAGGEEEEGSAAVVKKGMHSAAGAYWNSEKDGMYNFKYEKAESKGFDVIVSIIWISTS